MTGKTAKQVVSCHLGCILLLSETSSWDLCDISCGCGNVRSEGERVDVAPWVSQDALFQISLEQEQGSPSFLLCRGLQVALLSSIPKSTVAEVGHFMLLAPVSLGDRIPG